MLHPFQTEAIARLRAPSVHLALTAPTGSGKGRILEAIALGTAERILVVTPLVALGRQQRLRFRAIGIPDGRVRILGPESLLNRAREIRAWRPTFVAVDEAHCIHEWGERFRPAYDRLLRFLRELGCPRSLWMSATFPRALYARIRAEIPGDWRTQGAFALPTRLETRFARVSPVERVERLRDHVSARPEPGLLFVGTRKDVGRYLGVFGDGRPFLPYHAGMSDEERRGVEALLHRERDGEARTSVVATNAFGMGMDFPQFRWTALAGAPYSLLALMQAMGRVGRAGRAGEAALYWAEEDFRFGGLLLGTGDPRATSALADLRAYLEAPAEMRPGIASEVFL